MYVLATFVVLTCMLHCAIVSQKVFAALNCHLSTSHCVGVSEASMSPSTRLALILWFLLDCSEAAALHRGCESLLRDIPGVALEDGSI